MLVRLAGKLLWGTTKFTVRHIVIPIAITMVVAAVATELTERLQASIDADAEGGRQRTEAEEAAWHAQP